jgi:hypothetical protein
VPSTSTTDASSSLFTARPLPPRLLRHVVLTIAVRAVAGRPPGTASALLLSVSPSSSLSPSPSPPPPPPPSCRALITADDAAASFLHLLRLGRANQHLRRIHASRSPELAIKFYSKPPHLPPVAFPAPSTTRAVTVWNALQPSETGATGCASPASPNHARPSRANDSKTTLPLARLHSLHPSPVDARPSRDPSSLCAATGSVNVSGSESSACCCLWFAGRYSATRCMTHGCFRPTKRHVSSCNPVSTAVLRLSRLVSGLQNIHVVLASRDFGLGYRCPQSGVRPPCLECMIPIRVCSRPRQHRHRNTVIADT